MDPQDTRAILSDLLQLKPYYNVATCSDDQPWNSPVWAARDKKFNLYWSSWVEAVHSRNIAINSKAFLTIFDSTRERGTNNFRCLYLDCAVSQISDEKQAQMAAALLYPGEPVDVGEFLGPGLKRIYLAKPVRAWLNCLSERQLTPETLKMRTEIPIELLKAAL